MNARFWTRREMMSRAGEAGVMASLAAMPASAFATDQRSVVPREISDATMQLLLAMAEAVAGTAPLQGHYEAYYRTRAAYSAHYLDLYDRFAREVMRKIREAGHPDFLACDLAVRFGILEAIRSDPQNARMFEIAVFQETLAVFETTDAWILLGYDSWEGMARGLEAAQEPPSIGTGQS